MPTIIVESLKDFDAVDQYFLTQWQRIETNFFVRIGFSIMCREVLDLKTTDPLMRNITLALLIRLGYHL